MSAVEETIENENSSRRLTVRQKFWLLGVGLPALLLVVLLVLAVFLPKPLNPTEEKLIGRWEAVSPSYVKGTVIEFREHDAVYGSEPWLWTAGDRFLMTDMMTTRQSDRGLVHRVRLRFKLPVEYEKWKIDNLDETELRIQHKVMADPLVFQRVEQ